MAWLVGGAVMTSFLTWLVIVLYAALVCGCSFTQLMERRKAEKKDKKPESMKCRRFKDGNY